MPETTATQSDPATSGATMQCPVAVTGYSPLGCWQAQRLAAIVSPEAPDSEAVGLAFLERWPLDEYDFWTLHDRPGQTLVYGSECVEWLAAFESNESEVQEDDANAGASLKMRSDPDCEHSRSSFLGGVTIGRRIDGQLVVHRMPQSFDSDLDAKGPFCLSVYGSEEKDAQWERLGTAILDPTSSVLILPSYHSEPRRSVTKFP